MMRKRSICVAVALLLGVLPHSALLAEDDKKEQLEAARQTALDDPTQTSKARDEAPQLSLEVTEDGTFIVGSIGYKGKGCAEPWSVNLQLRATAEKVGETSLADLDGPLGDSVATLSFTYEWSTNDGGDVAKPLTPICQEYNQKYFAAAEKARQSSPELIDIKGGQCSDTELEKKKGTWGLRASKALSIDMAEALCNDFNKGRTSGRLLLAGIGDVPKDQSNKRQYPAGYDAVCTWTRVEPLWKQEVAPERGKDLRKAALKAVCEKHADSIPKGDCTEAHAGRVSPDWEESALSAACSLSGLAKSDECSWPSLAWAKRKAELEKKFYVPICEDFNNFDTKPLIDSRVGECSYKALAERGSKWEMRALRTMPVQPWFFTVSASQAEPDFEFIDPETLEEKKSSNDNKSISAQIATLRRGTWWSLAYTNRTTFSAGPKRELCSPVGGGGDLLCREVRVGAPSKKEKEIVQLDIKRPFTPRLGAIWRLLYDLEENLWNPHVLLFFLEQKSKDSKKSGLRGGLDLAYNEEDKFTARLFIGTKFDMSKPGN